MKNYDKLKKQMRQLIRMAKEVIEETEKTTPDDCLISDVAVEEMDELHDQICYTVLRDGSPVNESHPNGGERVIPSANNL